VAEARYADLNSAPGKPIFNRSVPKLPAVAFMELTFL
jgi:hypothetical protein